MSVVIKAKEAIKNNQLVGNTIFDETEYEELLVITRKLSKYFLDSSAYHIPDRENEIVFVTLVEITKRWKNITDDENDEIGFWDYVIKTVLGLERGNTNYNKLYKEYTANIMQGLHKNNYIIFAESGKKYYATLMLHAFAPAKSIYAFLDLCYNIFKKDLNFNYTENDKDICESITIRFCEILEKSVGNNMSISIGANSYNVRIGLRTLALENDTKKCFIDLLDEALININYLFYDQTINPHNYFEKLVVDWWLNKQALFGIDKKTSYKLTPVVSKNKIKVKFIRDNSNIYCVIPPIRLDNGLSNKYYLSVYVNGSDKPQIYEELFTIRGEFLDSTKQKDIDLNELLQNYEDIKIQIKIFENEKEIFNSKIIEKEFILFENENEISSNLLPTNNYFLYSRNIGLLETPENIKTSAAYLYNIYPKAGETISGVERKIYFQDEANLNKKDNIRLFGNMSSCLWIFENNDYMIFNNKVFIFIPNDIQLNGLELKISGKKYLLSELEYCFEETFYNFNITKYLPKNIPIDFILYSHIKEKYLIKMYIIVFHGLTLSFNNHVYYGNDDKKLEITFNNESDALSWNNKQNELTHPFQNGILIINPLYIKWRIDNNEWHNEPLNKKLWYKVNFHNGSFLQFISDIKIDRIDFDNCCGKIMPNKITQNFAIGNYIYSNENKKNISFTFPLFNENKSLFTVSTKEHFYKNPLLYSNEKLYWHAGDSFVGDEKRLFKLEIFNNKNERVYLGELSIREREDEIIEIDEGVYKIKISSKEESIFRNENIIFYEDEIIIGPQEKYRFANKCIKLTSASNGDTKEYWNSFSPNEYYIDKIEYIEQNYYLGCLYTVGKDGEKRYLNTMKDEKDRLDTINPVRLNILSDDKLELNAGYDKDDKEVEIGLLLYDTVSYSICNNATPNSKDSYRYRSVYFYRYEVKYV